MNAVKSKYQKPKVTLIKIIIEETWCATSVATKRLKVF